MGTCECCGSTDNLYHGLCALCEQATREEDILLEEMFRC